LPPWAIQEPCWGPFMAWGFRVAKAGEPPDHAQTVMGLRFRGTLYSPRDGGLGHDGGITRGGGKPGTAVPGAFYRRALTVRCTAHRELCLPSLAPHNTSAGHGLATCGRSAIATLA
jgi:hypothetical protein